MTALSTGWYEQAHATTTTSNKMLYLCYAGECGASEAHARGEAYALQQEPALYEAIAKKPDAALTRN